MIAETQLRGKHRAALSTDSQEQAFCITHIVGSAVALGNEMGREVSESKTEEIKLRQWPDSQERAQRQAGDFLVKQILFGRVLEPR